MPCSPVFPVPSYFLTCDRTAITIMSSALQLLEQAFSANRGQDNKKTIDLYTQCVKKILKVEGLTQQLPPGSITLSNEIPKEVLGIAFHQLTAFFREGQLNQDTAPDAYKLVSGFRSGSSKKFPRCISPEEKLLLKALQIHAGLTLGLVAWDQKDRATAAKRYQEALDLAATHPPWTNPDPRSKDLDRWAINNVKQIKDNFAVITEQDAFNAFMTQLLGSQGGDVRREVASRPYVREDALGVRHIDDTFTVATDGCGCCGKRETNLSCCAKCLKTKYCSRDCQVADWKSHKPDCRVVPA
ncbi:hypothetical protein QCA50_019372 [Cerrena zonata]|uniref:MYND-type domain-containing protein n=1 Tax=Cerrena zonata TaxID=2478898 RepID=A0AAW0FB32_9APHY